MPSSRHRIAIHWFRKGLRLHDNPALVAAATRSQVVIPISTKDEVRSVVSTANVVAVTQIDEVGSCTAADGVVTVLPFQGVCQW